MTPATFPTAPRCVEQNVLLSKHAYYRIGGPAKYFAQPKSENDLAELSDFIHCQKLRCCVLGAGSNTLFDDAGFDGLVIHTGRLDTKLHHTEAGAIEAGASVLNIQLLRLCMQAGLRGMEFLVGVPGSVGGAVFMNAGTTRGEARDRLAEVSCYDLDSKKTMVFEKNQLRFEYRAQLFLPARAIVLSARFQTEAADPKAVQSDIQGLLEKRKATQPIDKPSCGSVFKNPSPTQHAWKLIADAGLRGHQIGGAQISPLHTNFIVNLGGAKAADVRALIDLAKTKVQEKFGVLLQEEVKIVHA